jgi:hypothetical protein
VHGKHYPADRCAEVVARLREAGLTVACYGGPDNYWFDDTIDLRGAPLEIQCAALGGARCALGPSSGTLHLASLCNCPHLTWSAIDRSVAIRYQEPWNPLGTRVRFLTTPEPDPEEVYSGVLELMEDSNRTRPLFVAESQGAGLWTPYGLASQRAVTA